MKRYREEDNHHLLASKSKRQKLNNNTSKLIDHQYQIEQISNISLKTRMCSTNNTNLTIIDNDKQRNNVKQNNLIQNDRKKYQTTKYVKKIRFIYCLCMHSFFLFGLIMIHH